MVTSGQRRTDDHAASSERQRRGSAATKLNQLTALLDQSPVATVAVDARGRIQEWNPAAETLLGWAREEMLGTALRRLVPADETTPFGEHWAQFASGQLVPAYDAERLHRNGTRIPVRVHAVSVTEHGVFAGTVGTFRERPGNGTVVDLRERTAYDDHEDDELTGLLARRGLQRHLAAPVPAGMARAVAILDVDAFALVNQTYGPDVGDEVLRQVGRRLGAVAGEAAAGRWQADEFMYVLDSHDPTAGLDALVTTALRAVREPLSVGDQRMYLTLSAGLVTSTHVADGDLFSAATHATRAAQAAGRDRAVWFTAALRPAKGGGLRLANALRRGVERGEMCLHFQPIVALANRGVAGVEALVRWERPGFGLLSPKDFIDVAERTGQIVPLGAWVTEQACRTAVDLARGGLGSPTMSINLSARQLSDPGVCEMLGAALRDSGCPPSVVVIEVTETALMQDMDTATDTLQAMKDLGVSLALDDFGTGYSSLLYLKSFPVDRIKIDQSFVAGLGVNEDDTAIVASTISLAHNVGVKVVAEGVETVDQLSLLRKMRCDYAQGFLFSRPLSLTNLEQWLREHRPARRRRTSARPDATEAPDVSRILRLNHEGASLHTIAAALNVEGRRTERGVRWSPQSIAKVITLAEFPTIELPR